MRRIKNMGQLQLAVDQFRRYFDALAGCFVDREHIIHIMKYALAMHQHVLVFGPPGTAKTAVSDMVFSGITGAENFVVELSMYMTEDAIFGPLDPKRMREDGVLWHRTEGMLPEAHIARLGEFLDANMPTLRTLLGALHERRFRRGGQIVEMPLLTVYCDTNVNPHVYLERNPNAWAVIDRLLFISSVGFLKEPEQMAEMIERYQYGHTTAISERLDLEVIRDLSDLIVQPPSVLRDKLTIMKLGEAFIEYRNERKKRISDGKFSDVILPDITDRRFALATQLAEAEAVFSYRFNTEPSDILAIGHGIGTTEGELELWKKIAEEKVKEIEDEKRQQLDHAQLIALEALKDDLVRVRDDASSDTDTIVSGLDDLRLRLETIIPEDDTVTVRKDEVQSLMNEVRRAVAQRVLEERGLTV